MPRFSDFICSLRTGEEPSVQSFDAFLSKLRPALLRQVLWRGLWDRPPRYLGVVGASWADPGAKDELLADFCEFMVRRLPGLWKRCAEESNIDYLVYINIRNFIHETQEKHDPVGSRIYKILKSTVKKAIQKENLYLLTSDSQIRSNQEIDGGIDEERDQKTKETISYGSILGFTAQSDLRNAQAVDLAQKVEVWRAELLPDLVTDYQYTGVALRLEACIDGLRDQDVESFRFGDLMDCLRAQAREWFASAQHSSEGPSAREDTDDENPRLVPIAGPDTGIEGRDFLYKLRRCVIAGVEKLEETRTRGYLLKLWLFLHSWAAESAETGETPGFDGLEGDKLPSAKKLGEMIGVPRNRIPGLKETLTHLVRDCHSALSGKVPVREKDKEFVRRELSLGSPSYGRQDGSIDMSQTSRLEQIRAQMGEAAAHYAKGRARIESQKRWSPRLGDTFLFIKEEGAAPVEWVAVDQDPADLQCLLVVPVDDNPFIGSRDVEVPAQANGLTSIRCDLGIWLDGQTLDPSLRTGVLELEIVSQVRRKQREIEAGKCAGSWLEQEVDEDPEYREWREVLTEARAVLKNRSPGKVRSSSSSARWASVGSPVAAVASILLMVGLGLGGTVARQRAKIADLRQSLDEALFPAPQLDLPFHHFTGMEPVRGSDYPLVIPAMAKRIALIFEVADPEPYPSYRLEILDKDTKREIWSDDRLTRTGSEVSLDLPRSVFSSGSYLFRIYGLGETEPELLVEYALTVELE